MSQKKERKTDEEKQQIVLDLVMMDDTMFEAMCEEPKVLEEMIQTILGDSKLRIKEETVVAQKSIRNLKGRSIRMDAYFEGMEDEVFNIEIQRSNNCNHVKRVRYNASVITANNSEPGDKFEDVQELCVIYISEKDIFHYGRTIYHVQSTIQENSQVIDNGLKEIYVNTEVKDGSKISDLMDMFHKKELDEIDKGRFPNTYKKFHSLKHDKEEVEKMCDKIERYAKKEAIIAAIELCDEIGLDKAETIERIVKKFNLSQKDALLYYDEVFVTQ